MGLLLSERRSEDLFMELAMSQGWDRRRPPHGHILRQQEYRHFPQLRSLLATASKSGKGHGLPEALIVDRESLEPLIAVETKTRFQ